MSLSIIIAHFAPKVNCEKYFELLHDNITNLRRQDFNDDIEIIICDDGSYWSRHLFKNSVDEMIEIDREQIKAMQLFNDLDIDKYYGLKDVNRYRGVYLKDKAIKGSKYKKVVILDDDHHLKNRDALCLFSKYLDKYIYVKGRVIGPDHIPQLFLSRNAQGTTYGFHKDMYLDCGGFSEYLFENGYGEDNDILYKFYCYISNNYNRKMACFAADISTFDLATNRWADRAAGNILLQNQMSAFNQNVRHESFVRDFVSSHSVHPFKNNLSRIRYRWMVLPSINSFVKEIYYTFIYILFIPKIACNILLKIKRKGGFGFIKRKFLVK